MAKLTQEEYIRKASEVHNNFYSYPDAIYISGKHQIEITCPIHGNFWQLAETHKDNKAGCPSCARLKTAKGRLKTQEQFLEDVLKVHPEGYDFSNSKYVDSRTKLDVSCNKHGLFQIEPASLLNGRGCKVCMKQITSSRSRKTLSEFVRDAENTHGSKYKYHKSDYQGSKVKLEIVCDIHDSFWQAPDNHIAGAGCPACGLSGYNRSKPGSLYVLKSGDITKVGISNVSVNKRVKQIISVSKIDFEIVHTQFFQNGELALNIETKVLQWLRSKYKSPDRKFSGSTECFLDVNLAELINYVTPLG